MSNLVELLHNLYFDVKASKENWKVNILPTSALLWELAEMISYFLKYY